MGCERFFEKVEKHSQVKSRIVAKYFNAWAQVILNAPKHPEKIAYIDLLAGPGRYRDGTPSTPLLIIQDAIKSPELRGRLVAFFNDANSRSAAALRRELRGLPGVGDMKHEPRVENFEVNRQLADEFKKLCLVPSLVFLDPWGYKAITADLIMAMVKDWGCDCVFFFNYNRINMDLGHHHPAIRANIDAIFGVERANELREKLKSLRGPAKREKAVLTAMGEGLADLGVKLFLPFRFRNTHRTTHYLMLVTKHFKGYDIMKGIMAKESSWEDEGVPSFEFGPQRPLPGLAQLLEVLKEGVVKRLAGRTLSFEKLYELDSVGTVYVRRNYKKALASLEEEGRISAEPPATKRRKGTFADTVKVRFPGKQ